MLPPISRSKQKVGKKVSTRPETLPTQRQSFVPKPVKPAGGGDKFGPALKPLAKRF